MNEEVIMDDSSQSNTSSSNEGSSIENAISFSEHEIIDSDDSIHSHSSRELINNEPIRITISDVMPIENEVIQWNEIINGLDGNQVSSIPDDFNDDFDFRTQLPLNTNIQQNENQEKSKSSQSEQISQRPNKRPYSEYEDEAITCTICTEEWTSSGKHQVVSLGCGHLFGKRCIETWFNTKTANSSSNKLAPCPMCNAKFKLKDIRKIWTKNIKALDVSVRDAHIKMSEEAIREKDQMKRALNSIKLTNSMLQYELNKARAKIESLNKQLNEMKNNLTASDLAILVDENTVDILFDYISPNSFGNQLPNKIFKFNSKVEISSDVNTARVMSFNENKKLIIVGRKFSPTSFGLTSFNLDPKSTQFSFKLHDAQLRDIKIYEENDVVRALTVGMDTKMVLSDPSRQSIINTFSLPAPGWSCCFSTLNSCIYAGTTNGRIVEFDSNRLLSSLPSRTICRNDITSYSPIHSLYFIEAYSILLGANVNGVYLWTLGHFSDVRCIKLLDGGSIGTTCYSLSYNEKNKCVLASFRCSETHSTIHKIGMIHYDLECQSNILDNLDGISFQTHYIFSNDAQETAMPRSTVIYTPDPYLIVRDEVRKEILIWEIPPLDLTQSSASEIKTNPARIRYNGYDPNRFGSFIDFEFCEFGLDGKAHLIALTTNHVIIFDVLPQDKIIKPNDPINTSVVLLDDEPI